MPTRSLSLAGAAVAATTLAACGGADFSRAAAAHVTPAAAERAVRTAGAAVRHGRAYDLERDRGHVWDVEVAIPGSLRPYELRVSADGRRVLHRHRDDSRSDDARKARDATVPLQRALRIAARRAGGALSEAEIDRDRRGRLVWKATFERGAAETEVSVHARTGSVTNVRHEHDDD